MASGGGCMESSGVCVCECVDAACGLGMVSSVNK